MSVLQPSVKLAVEQRDDAGRRRRIIVWTNAELRAFIAARDAGESVASLRRRSDDANWPAVLAELQQGATLVRPTRLRDYYLDRGRGPNNGVLSQAQISQLERAGAMRRIGVLSAARVRKLEEVGVLRRVGVDRYGLADGGADG